MVEDMKTRYQAQTVDALQTVADKDRILGRMKITPDVSTDKAQNDLPPPARVWCSGQMARTGPCGVPSADGATRDRRATGCACHSPGRRGPGCSAIHGPRYRTSGATRGQASRNTPGANRRKRLVASTCHPYRPGQTRIPASAHSIAKTGQKV